MTDVKVSWEAAEAEFERFAELWDFDAIPLDASEEEQDNFASLKRQVMRGLCKGYVWLNEDGNVVVKLRYSDLDGIEEVEFAPGRGRDFSEQQKHKTVSEQTFAMLAQLATNPKIVIGSFKNMDMRDLRPMQAVVACFLAL